MLGISPTTISNVLNGRTEKMSAETRQKIEEALCQNHYKGSEKNGKGSSEEKFVVAAFYMGDRENVLLEPFCGELLGAMEREIRPYGRFLIYTVPDVAEDLKQILSPWNVEGAILLGYPPEQCVEFQKRFQKPLVFIDSYFGEGEDTYDNIGLQDFEGAYELTTFLLKQGHRKIAFFCDQPDPIASNGERYKGFQKAIQSFGLEFSERDFHYLPGNKLQRHEVLRRFARNVDRTYTAAFFVSDFYAGESIHVFCSQGLRVPDDVSIVGFDDNIYAKLSRPMLTTIRQSPTEKGREAVKLLMRRIHGEEVVVRSMQLPTELIVRDSVKNIG